MTSFDQLTDDEWAALVAQVAAMPDAPAPWLARMRALWPEQRPALPGPQRPPAPAPQHETTAAGRPPLVRRWLAVLSFDSATTPPVAIGMRALRSQTRQLLFTWQEIDLDLRVAPMATADGWALSGQLLGADPQGHLALIGPGHEVTRTVALDALGEFGLDGVASGSYHISVHLGGGVLELPALDIGPPTMP